MNKSNQSTKYKETKVDTITFRTQAQANLWNEEIVGQLSDGMWENTSPQNHWRVWSNAEVKVGPNVGRNFYARKDNYNLTALVEYVGDRMLKILQLEAVSRGREDVACGLTMKDLKRELAFMKATMKTVVEREPVVTVPVIRQGQFVLDKGNVAYESDHAFVD